MGSEMCIRDRAWRAPRTAAIVDDGDSGDDMRGKEEKEEKTETGEAPVRQEGRLPPPLAAVRWIGGAPSDRRIDRWTTL